MNSGYDIIGDIHGHADKLTALLRSLGYTFRAGGWLPPLGRQAVFVGDLVDRGPKQIEVVRTVRAMIDTGHAHAVMGNHEFNAIGYATPSRTTPGAFLRPHTPKNVAQHAEFLRQVGEGSATHREIVEWFRTLPPALDLGGIRVVHAWWHQPHVDLVAADRGAGPARDDDFLHAAYDRGSPEWAAMEGLTKGLEIRLPDGHSFRDHAGVERRHVRTRWWLEAPRTYRDVAITGTDRDHEVPDHPLPDDFTGGSFEGAPVFVGHYWMTGTPRPQAPAVACVDYSAGRNGPLVAYRWDGEARLEEKRFVTAG